MGKSTLGKSTVGKSTLGTSSDGRRHRNKNSTLTEHRTHNDAQRSDGDTFDPHHSQAQGRPGLIGRTSQFVTSAINDTVDATKAATLNTTTSILKTAGSATSNYILHPTATIVARDILPELFTLLYEYVKAITPQRGRDVARIFGSGGRNLMHVLSETPRGQSFLATNAATFDSLISTISSPLGRQVRSCEDGALNPQQRATRPVARLALHDLNSSLR